MKTTTLPPLRVTPRARRAIEAVLEDGETLSSFMLHAVTEKAEVRKDQKAFLAKAVSRSREVARTGRYVTAEAVFSRLEQTLVRARRKAPSR